MVDVVTYGCRLNIFESEQIKKAAKQANLKNTIIVNSCAVTQEAERQLRQNLRKMHKNNPDKQIIVTGCAAQISPEKYANFSGVVKVIGNNEKGNAASYALNDRIEVADIMNITDLKTDPITGFEGKARGYIQVQNGCDHRCTFCTIPFGRGNSRSLPIGEVVKQANILLDNNYNELVLTGVDMTGYGADLPGRPKLGEMVKRLLSNCPRLKRLRLSSIDVAEIDSDLLELFKYDKRLMPHIHLSLQAGDNMVLKRMKRRHTREQVIEFCNDLYQARPGITFGADIIAGFPTETDEMFNNTLQLVNECRLVHLHVFPYSPRDNTPAARMPQVLKQTRKMRAQMLRNAGITHLKNHMQNLVGTSAEIIVEDNNTGRLPDYCTVNLPANHQLAHGHTAHIKINNLIGDQLCCEIID